ncbi:FG-GAP repeat protein [Streptosporangium subroseum]|uniref:FG-GAP repeat protein n=1 Tax=Streptosporangium subroseum TaxID=106412 RepID=UPI003086AF67|nr:FG-GAP repeat protein [Streptosporangium subroseum]
MRPLLWLLVAATLPMLLTVSAAFAAPAAASVALATTGVVPAAAVATVTALTAAGSALAMAAGPADCAAASASDFNGDGVDDTVVGDPFASPGGRSGAGAAHVLFGRGESGAAVTSPEVQAGDGFGWSARLAHLDADRCADLLIGAPYTDVAGRQDAGAVYAVYGGPQRRTVRMAAPEPEADAHFGWSLAAGGTLVAVGAPHENADGVPDAGAVYLFETGALDTPKKISQGNGGVAGNSEDGDMFGWSLEIGRLNGDGAELDLAVGAPYENDDGIGQQVDAGKLDAGSITMIFDVRGAGDTYASKKWDFNEIPDPDPDDRFGEAGDRFGYAMAYAEEGDTRYLAASAPLGDGASVKDSGLVQLFQSSGAAAMAPSATFDQGPEGVTGDGYGFSLALTGEGGARMAVGVPFDGPDRRGGVHLVPMGDASQARMINQSEPGDHFGWSVAFSGNRLVIGAPDRGASGTVLLLGRNDTEGIPLSPGAGKVPALNGGASADFGAAVS